MRSIGPKSPATHPGDTEEKLLAPITPPLEAEEENEGDTLTEAKKTFDAANKLLPLFEKHFKKHAHQTPPSANVHLTFEDMFRSLKEEMEALKKGIDRPSELLMIEKTTYVMDLLTQLLRMGIVFARIYPNEIDKTFVAEMTAAISPDDPFISAEEVERCRALIESGKMPGLLPKPKLQEERKTFIVVHSDEDEPIALTRAERTASQAIFQASLWDQMADFELALSLMKDDLVGKEYSESDRLLVAAGKLPPKDQDIKRIELCLKELKIIMTDKELNRAEKVGVLREKFHSCIVLYDFGDEVTTGIPVNTKNKLKLEINDPPFVIEEKPKRTLEDIMKMIDMCKDFRNPPVIKFSVEVRSNLGKKEKFTHLNNARDHLELLHGLRLQLLTAQSEEQERSINLAMALCRYIIKTENKIINDSSFFQNPKRIERINVAIGLLQLVNQKIESGRWSGISFSEAIDEVIEKNKKAFNSFDEELHDLIEEARNTLVLSSDEDIIERSYSKRDARAMSMSEPTERKQSMRIAASYPADEQKERKQSAAVAVSFPASVQKERKQSADEAGSYSEFSEEQFEKELQEYLPIVQKHKAKIEPLIKEIINLINQEEISLAGTTRLVVLSGELREKLKSIFSEEKGKPCDVVPEKMMFAAIKKEYFSDNSPFKINTPFDEKNQQLLSYLRIAQDLMGIRSRQGILDLVATHAVDIGKGFEKCLYLMGEKEALKLAETKAMQAKKEEPLESGIVNAVLSEVQLLPSIREAELKKELELQQVQDEISKFLALLIEKEAVLKERESELSKKVNEVDSPSQFRDLLDSTKRNIQRIGVCQSELKLIQESKTLNSTACVKDLKMRFHGCVLLLDYAAEAKKIGITVEDQPFCFDMSSGSKRTPQDAMRIINLCKDLQRPPCISIITSSFQSDPAVEKAEEAARHLASLGGYQKSLQKLSKEAAILSKRLAAPDITKSNPSDVALIKKKIELTNLAILLCKYVLSSSHDEASIKGAKALLRLIHKQILELNQDKKSDKKSTPTDYNAEMESIKSKHPKLFEISEPPGELAGIFEKTKQALPAVKTAGTEKASAPSLWARMTGKPAT